MYVVDTGARTSTDLVVKGQGSCRWAKGLECLLVIRDGTTIRNFKAFLGVQKRDNVRCGETERKH